MSGAVDLRKNIEMGKATFSSEDQNNFHALLYR